MLRCGHRRSSASLAETRRMLGFPPILENDMKVSMIALALAVSATTLPAFAANPAAAVSNVDGQHTQQWTPAQNTAAKSRLEVRQELARATKSGELASLNKIYQGS